MADIEKRRGDNASSLFSFWKNLFGVSVGPINSAAQKFALAQVRLDETRIACALERYHLTHQAYPATLEELAPTYIDAVPHDIINGQPFHYQARADGTFTSIPSAGMRPTTVVRSLLRRIIPRPSITKAGTGLGRQ